MRNRLQLTGLGEALTKAAQEKLEQESSTKAWALKYQKI